MTEERKPEGGAPLGADLVIPAIALGFALYFFLSIRDLAWEAKANGVMIGSILVVLIVIQLVRIGIRISRREANLRFDPLWHPRESFWPRIGLVAITVAFIALMKWLGLTLALLLGMLASLRLLGIRRPKILFGLSFAVAFAVYILFIAVLDAAFPHGPIEDLLAPLLPRRS